MLHANIDPEEQAFLEQIREEPGNQTVRHVYADWLTERGAPELAVYWRSDADTLPMQNLEEVSLGNTERHIITSRLCQKAKRSGGRIATRSGVPPELFPNHRLFLLPPEEIRDFDTGRAELSVDEVTWLPEMTNLSTLIFRHQSAVPELLDHAADLQSLVCLSLKSSLVRDEDLPRLAAFSDLKFLHLGDTEITDAGLRELVNVESLWSLDLYGTEVTEAGCRVLAEHPGLRVLRLHQTTVTAKRAVQLQELFGPQVDISAGR